MNPSKPNFIEVSNIDDANTVDMDVFRFERFSDTKGAYIFVRRRGQ